MTLLWFLIITIGITLFGCVIGAFAALIVGPPSEGSWGVGFVMLFWVMLYVIGCFGGLVITWRLMQ